MLTLIGMPALKAELRVAEIVTTSVTEQEVLISILARLNALTAQE